MGETNGKYLLTEDDIFMMQGRTNNFAPSDEQLKEARAMAKAMNMDIFRQRNAAMNPTNIQSAGTLTNEVTGDVYPVARDGAGRIAEFIKPEVLQTTTGIEYISGPGQTRNFINRDTGQQPKGYAASGSFYGMGQPVVGGDNSAARDAAAAATASPTPAPQPYAMTNAEGSAMSFSSPYDVRAAFKGGSLTQDEARKALTHFGIK
jgi:hypothetical protein